MAIQVGLLSPGDMGHVVGQVLLQHGMRVVTCLQGRSERTCMLSRKAGIAEVPTYEQLVREADLLLSFWYRRSAEHGPGHRTGATQCWRDDALRRL